MPHGVIRGTPQPLARSSCAPAPDRPRSASHRQEGPMPASPDQRLAELGITLPKPAAPVANYVGVVRTGNLLVVSGQLCFGPDGKLAATGKLGAGVAVEEAKTAARLC